MTVETNDTIDRQTISGTGPYSYSFRIFDRSELIVRVDTGALDPVTLVYDTHYTIDGVNDEDGGTITLTAGTASTYAGDFLDVRSSVAQEQSTSIRNQGAFLPEVHENALDNLARQLQDLNRVVAQKWGYPDTTTLNGSMTLRTAWAERWPYVNADGVIEPSVAIATQALTQSIIGQLLFPASSAEASAAVTIVNPQYYYGDVRRYGVTGDGTTNDTVAFQRALTVGGYIYAPVGLTILIASVLTMSVAKSTVDLGGSSLKFSASYDDAGTNDLIMMTVSGADCTIRSAIFDGSAKGNESHRNAFVQFTNNASRGKVHDCRFVSLDDGGDDANGAVLFLTGADDGEVYSCSFHDCPGAAFSQGTRPRFLNCVVTAPKDVSFALNSPNCSGGSVIGCKIYNNNETVSGHIAAEEGASDWVFANNYVYGVKNGSGIAALNVAVLTVAKGGVIANNVIDGGGFTTTGPSALISVSQYYKNCRVVNNVVERMPAGLASNAAITVPALGTLLQGNIIDATTGSSAVAAVVVTPAGGQIDIIDNYCDCTGGPGRHFVFDSGSNSSHPAIFEGGTFIGGTVAIDTDLNDPTNMPIWLINLKRNTATSLLSLTGTDSIEDFFNTHNAISQHHVIKGRRTVYGNAAPTAGTWVQGDFVWNIAPAAGGAPGWVCTADGTPGTWKAMASVAA
jgi:hypothetical protein